MQQESPDELDTRDGHDPAAVAVGAVFPGESYAIAIDTENPTIGDGDTVCVPSEVLQDLNGSSERRLGVNYPLLAADFGHGARPLCRISEVLQAAMELEVPLAPGAFEPFDVQAPEESAEHANR